MKFEFDVTLVHLVHSCIVVIYKSGDSQLLTRDDTIFSDQARVLGKLKVNHQINSVVLILFIQKFDRHRQADCMVDLLLVLLSKISNIGCDWVWQDRTLVNHPSFVG